MRRVLTIIAAAMSSVLLVGGIAAACITNGISSSAQCGEQITWTAYVASGDGVQWGSASLTKPSNVAVAPTNDSGTPFSTTTFVPASQHGETWYITEVATNGNQHGTTYYASQYVDAYSNCNPTPGPTVTKTVPGPTVTVTASISVPGPTVTVTDTPPPTIVTVTKTPKPVTVVKKVKVPVIVYRTPKGPRAVFVGPCGDPFYRVTLINPTKHAIRFYFQYTAFGSNSIHSLHRTVGAGKSARTGYVHVLGGTLMAVVRGNGTAVAVDTAAPAGNYRACRS